MRENAGEVIAREPKKCTLIVSIQAGDQNTADRIAWALAGHVNAEFGAHTRRADEDERDSAYEMTFGELGR